MATNIPNYQKIVNLLKEKGCEEERINSLIADKNSNSQKQKALDPLCKEFGVRLEARKKSILSINSSLKDYFGVTIAQLLVERKKLSQLKDVNIETFKTKNFENLNNEELKQLYSFLQVQKDKTRLDKINQKLIEKGIIFQ